jgi:hypothetical protein
MTVKMSQPRRIRATVVKLIIRCKEVLKNYLPIENK